MISSMSRGSAEFISLMYRTALSWSLQCTGQRWVDIYNVQNSADFFSTSIVWICTYLRVVIRKFHWILNNLRKYSVYELHKMCLTMYIYKGTVSQTYRILEFFLFIMAWQRGFWNLFRLTEPSYLFVKHPKQFFLNQPCPNDWALSPTTVHCTVQVSWHGPFYMFLLYFYHMIFGCFVFYIVVFIRKILKILITLMMWVLCISYDFESSSA